MVNNGICIECNGEMHFNPVPFSILDFMEKSTTQLLNTNDHMHQRLLMHEQMCEQQTACPPTSKPTSPSKLQKNADEFKPGMFQENLIYPILFDLIGY